MLPVKTLTCSIKGLAELLQGNAARALSAEPSNMAKPKADFETTSPTPHPQANSFELSKLITKQRGSREHGDTMKMVPVQQHLPEDTSSHSL